MFCLILLPLINNDLQAKLPRVYFPQIPQPISHFSISLRGSLTFQLTKCMEQQPEETRFPPSPLMVSGKHISQPREEKRTSSSSSVTVCASQRNNSTFARSPALMGLVLTEELGFWGSFYLVFLRKQNRNK